MIQKPLSATTYSANILAGLQATGVSQTAAGGKARALADNIAGQIGTLEANQFSNLVQTFLPYMEDDTLDYFGAIWDVPRLGRVDATVSESDNNFQFYVRYGTFGSINNGNSITVPAGTQLYTADGITGVVYATTSDIVLDASASSAFFSATAISTGSAGKISAGVLKSSSFSGYADARYGSLLVTNQLGVVSGRDRELDDDYRYRISLRLQSSGGSQQSDIEAAVLQVAGVQDMSLERKAGTFIAYIYGISPDVGASLLQDCQAAINSVVAYPLNGIAIAPDLIGISLETSIIFVPGTSSSVQTQIFQTAAAAAQSYIDNLPKGATLVINEIASLILGSDSRILDIGNPNQPLNSIHIWRSRADGTRYSRSLIGDYTPQTGERIVVENIANAINLVLGS